MTPHPCPSRVSCGVYILSITQDIPCYNEAIPDEVSTKCCREEHCLSVLYTIKISLNFQTRLSNCHQPIRSHVRKFMLTNVDFNRNLFEWPRSSMCKKSFFLPEGRLGTIISPMSLYLFDEAEGTHLKQIDVTSLHCHQTIEENEALW